MQGTRKSVRYVRVALMTASLAFVIVIFNAYVRISNAGVECAGATDCFTARTETRTADSIKGEVEPDGIARIRAEWKGGVEGFFSVFLGLSLVRLGFLGWKHKKKKQSQRVVLPIVLLLVLLGIAGLRLFTTGLTINPLFQIAQWLTGLTGLALLWWLALREQRFLRTVTTTTVTRSLRFWTTIGLVVTVALIVTGTWSQVNLAGPACPDFPTCQTRWWPPMDFLAGFTLWWEQALEYDGRMLSLPAATAIHMTHRLVAFISLVYLGWLALHFLAVGVENNLCRYGFPLLLLLLVEIVFGVMLVIQQWPVLIAMAHVGTAVLLLVSMVTLCHVVRPPRSV